MTRDDFETDAEWDSYLEEVESVVYDRVHGDADAQAEAKEKVHAHPICTHAHAPSKSICMCAHIPCRRTLSLHAE